MLFHEFENKDIGIRDDESMPEDVDDGPDVEVLGTIELRLFWGTPWFRYTSSLEKFPTYDSRVLLRWLEYCNHVV